ncbi:MAG: class I SAM-dependent methyltransferase [Chrysiogenia bacterium]
MFAFEARIGDEVQHDIDASGLAEDSDVISGIIVNEASDSVYVIENSIAILLADKDIDPSYLDNKIKSIQARIPTEFNPIVERHLNRNLKRNATNVGKWNSEEMGFYDRAVDDDKKREAMLREIREMPIWRNYIPRQKYIVNFIKPYCRKQTILEIGSGNSRTIANIFRPKDFGYRYVGSDISFKRLLVAKQAIPEGDFIQASAMNLPFVDNSFQAIISFGMLHHLPEPMTAISGCVSKIKENGFLCFHEPIVKPKILGSRKTTLGRIFTTYEHSEHDRDLDLAGSLTLLKDKDLEIVKRRNFNSFFKTFAEFFLQKATPKKFHMSKFVVRSLFFIDRFFLNTFCRIWKGFGPHGVIVVAKKKG